MRYLALLLVFGVSNAAFAADDKLFAEAGLRDSLIQKAQVWSDPGDIAQIKIFEMYKTQEDSIPYNKEVRCIYDEDGYKEMATTGMTRKFWCRESSDTTKDSLKVKYALDNGEVFAEAVSTRLFQILGFYTDNMHPVDLKCLNCPAKPWEFMEWQATNPRTQLYEDRQLRVRNENRKRMGRTVLYPEAVIETKAKGKGIYLTGKIKPGWAWDELAKVSSQKGGSSKAQVDALRLMAAFIQHGDSKAEQQRLVCSKKDLVLDAHGNLKDCLSPRLVVQDLGATLGYSTKNLVGINMVNEGSKMNLAGWKARPVWQDKKNCVAELSKSFRGTIDDPKISEDGRAFLASLLAQVTTEQVHDLFKAARIDMRGEKIDDWVKAFNDKRAEIINHPGCGK